jgi:MFS family permease
MNFQPDPARILGRKRLRVITILLTSSVTFMASVVAPGLPAIYEEFSHVPEAELLTRLVLTIPMLFIALAGPFVGIVIDIYGRRNTLILSTIGFGISGLSGLILESLISILIGRAFLGIFLVAILTSVTALIGDYYSGNQRNRIAGLQAAFIAFGTLTYTIIAGFLTEIHWRAGFAIFAVAFLLIIPMILSLYEPTENNHKKIIKPTKSIPLKNDWSVIGGVYMITFITMIILFMIPAQTPFFLLDIGVNSAARTGIAVGIFSLSSGIASLAFPWLRKHFSVSFIFALIFVDVAVGYILLGMATDFYDVILAMIVGGFSMGLFSPNANLVILSRITSAFRGRALSVLVAVFFLGQFASPFYSLPLAKISSLGDSYLISGYILACIGVFFIILTAYNKKSILRGNKT